MTGRKYHDRPGKASSARRRGRVSYPDSVRRCAPRTGRRVRPRRHCHKARRKALPGIERRGADYLAGVAQGQVEGQRLAYTTIMIEANKLLEKLPKDTAAPVQGIPQTPSKPSISYDVRDCQ